MTLRLILGHTTLDVTLPFMPQRQRSSLAPLRADSCGSRPATFDRASIVHRLAGSILTPC